MVDLSGFATGGFRFNKAYKIRILVAAPSDRVALVSELNLCCIFLHTAACLGSREKGTAAKCGFADVHHNAVGILKHGAGVVVTHQRELIELGREILEL